MIFLAIPILGACTAGTADHGHEHAEVTKTETKKAEELQLNNGAKWKLDAPTRQNIAEIRPLLAGGAEGKDLQQAGTALQEKTDQLISECRMAGPDHDALHLWLKDYLADLKVLKDGDREAYVLLQKDLEVFDQHFE